jgi:phage baseplate assembly protein W
MSNVLSDYNSSTITSGNVAKKNIYSDLDLSFIVHPILKDIRPVFDLDAVKNSVKNIVLTSFYDRPFHPEVGCGVRALLFEPASIFTALSIKDEILRCLGLYEPRINNVTVQITDNSDNNSYIITIGFVVLYDQQEEVQFYLNRLR